MRIKQTLAAAVLLLLVLTPACKEGDPFTSGLELPTPSFVAETPPAEVTDYFITLGQTGTSGSRVYVDVVIHDVAEDVTGIALKMTYPADFSKFIGCADGELFPPGTCYDAEPGTAGEIFIARAVASMDEATNVVGSTAIVSLEFLVFGEGQGAIEFLGQNLGGGDASALLDENGDPIFMHWYSGTLVGE